MQARVWNEDSEKYEEVYKNKLISIPAKGTYDKDGLPSNFVTMDYSEGNNFLGTYTPIIRDGLGNDKRLKKLRIERIDGTHQELKSVIIPCPRCGLKFHTQDEIDNHIMANHLADLDKKSRDEFVQSQEAAPKRKPGRPPKEPQAEVVAS